MSQCFCRGKREIPTTQPFSMNNLHIAINGSYLQIFDDTPDGPVVYVPVNYCPHCGRKLETNISRNTE